MNTKILKFFLLWGMIWGGTLSHADMLFYYSAAVLPAITSSGQQTNHVVADAGEDKTMIFGQSVTITGKGTATNGVIVSYVWKEGDALLSSEATFTYTPTVVGMHTLTLTVIADDGKSDIDTMTVNVTDGTAPVITVTGTNPRTVEQYSVYVDEGATATDDVDDVVTVVTSGSVDTNIVGDYILTYTAEDSAGNRAIPKTRTVHVIDVTPPVITITGDETVTVELGAAYTDAGATATDNVDSEVTVVTNGFVDTSRVGDYILTYTAEDSAGNSATPKTRTVHVVDTTAPVFTSPATVEVDENQNSAITLVATDLNTITYSITGGDSNDFDINSTSGVVTFKTAPDYESGKTSYAFTAKATDGAGNVSEQGVTITIKNLIDTAPRLAATSLSVEEDAVAGTVVGNVTIVDSGDTPITGFTLSGSGDGNFTIDLNGEITVATGATLDYETTPVYHFTAVAFNESGSSAGVSVDINVTEHLNLFQTDKLLSSDIEKEDYFGGSVSISGDYIIVGANGEGTGGSRAGAVYLYEVNSDSSVRDIAKIQASDKSTEDYFGSSVSISGDYIVVGAHHSAIGGAAYLYKIESNNTVTEIVKIQASDMEANDYFGGSVSISGDYIVVGAWGEDTGGTDAGAAYLYKIESNNTVTEIAKIQASDIEADDHFGLRVSISGDYIVIGSPYEDQEYSDYVGAAYLFKRNSDNSISEIRKIQASDKEGGDFFGSSVSINGDYIVVGAKQHDGNIGAAYVYKKNIDDTVAEITKIQASDKKEGESFGSSVSVSEDYIVVGAENSDISGVSAGAAYLFKIDSDSSVREIMKMQSHDIGDRDYFGNAVSISGDYIVVGARLEDTGGTDAGAAYLFNLKAIDKPYIYDRPRSTIYYDETLVNTNLYSFTGSSPSNESILFSIEGTDSGSFMLIDNNLSFNLMADFEDPVDSDANNDYNITITARDVNNHKTSVNVNIVLNDKHYLSLKKLQANDKIRKGYFGTSVSSSENYIVVGAYGAYYIQGSAYLYKRNLDNSVEEIAKIQASDKPFDADFGKSVSMSGNYIVVGARNDSSGESSEGSAYVYKIDSDGSVREIAKIQASDKEANDYFGVSVSISGNFIVVGADGEDTGGRNAGAAYIFKIDSNDTVSEIAKIQASDKQSDDAFGTSVSISGDYVTVGAPNEGYFNHQLYNGAVYLYKIKSDGSVEELAKIVASYRREDAYFGNSVSINGNNIVVGSKGEHKIYLYKINLDDTVEERDNITKSKGYFGSSVSISGNNIVVGAKYEEYGTGAAYLFRIDSDGSMREIDKLEAIDKEENDNFGISVSVSGTNVVIGANLEDTGAEDAGATYLFVEDVNQAE